MQHIRNDISIPDNEIELTAIRAQGPGGQHVNKASTAIQLRFDIEASSLPDGYKEKLLNWQDNRISGDGIIVITAQQYRSQKRNREDALNRLVDLVRQATAVRKKRKRSKPSRSAIEKRLEEKKKRGKQKELRRKPEL